MVDGSREVLKALEVWKGRIGARELMKASVHVCKLQYTIDVLPLFALWVERAVGMRIHRMFADHPSNLLVDHRST